MNEQKQCRSCNSAELKRFLALGDIPPVNSFLDYSEIKNEKKYPLNLAYCPDCLLVQLETIVPPEELFSNYLHLSSGSSSNISHLKEVSDMLNARFNISPNKKILEIGSNDGTLLSYLKTYTSNLLGIDPAKNLAPITQQKFGVETLPLFFNTTTAAELLKTRGAFDIIVALNVIPHTPNVVDLLKGVHMLLSPNGTLVMEGAYALETILKGEFDTIYHEHVYSFSLHSLIETFKRASLKVVDVQKIPTQGGSLRIFAQREKEAMSQNISVATLLNEEKEQGLTNSSTYENIGSKVEQFKKELKNIIEQEKISSGKLIGIGAPARGVVILNYCGIGKEDIEYVIDDTPLKQGRFAPGVHIPVKSWSSLASDSKRAFLLLSWNYREHLLKKLKNYVPKGRVIVPFPKLEVLNLG